MMTGSRMSSWPMTGCSSISFTTTEMELSAKSPWKPEPLFPKMAVGFPEWVSSFRITIVTELPREIYGVYHNEGKGTFSYQSLQTGLGALSSGSSGWGVGLEDFDNDGWKDLFVAQSHVLDNVEQIDPSLHYKELPLLAMNRNGRFERVDSGASSAVAARGAAFG